MFHGDQQHRGVSTHVFPGASTAHALTLKWKMWRSTATGTAIFIASPAVSGASGDQVIFAGDLAGTEHAYSLATGTQVFTFNAGTTIFSSSAIVRGMVFFGLLDGNVHALG